MKVQGQHYRTIWLANHECVQVIDQRRLPHAFVVEDLTTVEHVAIAIKEMHVRGAGLIGATAAYGMYLGALHAPRDGFDRHIENVASVLMATRPTAVNLEWAVHRQLEGMQHCSTIEDKADAALRMAAGIADEDAGCCKRIGEHGVAILEQISCAKGGARVNILTHCNAGWLAFVDFGSATAPIYEAFERGLDVHVWVDETRPRNQGASLTAWELGQQGVPHTVIVDNAGGHLMQHGMVDLAIVGTDRTTRCGDVANKIGTYLKALAAHDNGIPFYVALPSSSFDWQMRDGIAGTPIEQRNPDEVRYAEGMCGSETAKVLLTPATSPCANYAFDVTPARLITGLITERGICAASEEAIARLYPEKSALRA